MQPLGKHSRPSLACQSRWDRKTGRNLAPEAGGTGGWVQQGLGRLGCSPCGRAAEGVARPPLAHGSPSGRGCPERPRQSRPRRRELSPLRGAERPPDPLPLLMPLPLPVPLQLPMPVSLPLAVPLPVPPGAAASAGATLSQQRPKFQPGPTSRRSGRFPVEGVTAGSSSPFRAGCPLPVPTHPSAITAAFPPPGPGQCPLLGNARTPQRRSAGPRRWRRPCPGSPAPRRAAAPARSAPLRPAYLVAGPRGCPAAGRAGRAHGAPAW